MGVVALLPMSTVLDQMLHTDLTLCMMTLACLGFVAVYYRQISQQIRSTSAVLVVGTIGAMPFSASLVPSLSAGIRIGCLISGLLVAVNMLSKAAMRTSQIKMLVSGLYDVQPDRRYLTLSIASQFFGGFLGLAGIRMLFEAAGDRLSNNAQEDGQMFCAISRGYASLSIWSPMYSNMSIVLSLYQGATWYSFMPIAVLVSAFLMGTGILIEYLRKVPAAQRTSAAHKEISKSLVAKVSLSMIVFMSAIVALSGKDRLPISSAIIIAALILAWVINSIIIRSHEKTDLPRTAGEVFVADLVSFRTTSGEVLLFFVSGCAGTVIASAIPGNWIAFVSQYLQLSPAVSVMFLMVAIIVMSMLAVHPMLGAVLVASSLPPGIIHLHPLIHMCAVLVGWGLGIIISPFSVISLMASRLSRMPLLTISMKANLLYVVLCIAGSVLGLTIAGYWADHF